MMDLAGWIIGLQILSAHYGSAASQLETFTPGIYAMHPSGATLSLYRNSEGRTSFAAGWTWQYEYLGLTLGAVTGYKYAVMPLVIPSVRIYVSESTALRIMLVPPIKDSVTGAITVGFEMDF